MKLIVGLGNPGKKYEHTRHNAGFLAIDFLEHTWKDSEDFLYLGREKNKRYELSEWEYRNKTGGVERITCIKPQLFMNLSGEAVRFACDHAGRDFSVQRDLWVMHDEIDIPFGQVKLDRNRSSAGHNGVQNSIDQLGTKDFIRFRIGVSSHTEEKGDTETFVLNRFSKDERDALEKIFAVVEHSIRLLLEENFEAAQNMCRAVIPRPKAEESR